MARPSSVYIETTIVSYLAARSSRDLRVAAHQEITLDWWTRRRHQFKLYVSQLVVDEAERGDPVVATRRVGQLAGIPKLALTRGALVLAQRFVSQSAIPREASEDALHIAIAAVHGVDYLLTWNCRHIANATIRTRIQELSLDSGYEAPVICTPEELLED